MMMRDPPSSRLVLFVIECAIYNKDICKIWIDVYIRYIIHLRIDLILSSNTQSVEHSRSHQTHTIPVCMCAGGMMTIAQPFDLFDLCRLRLNVGSQAH